MAESKQTTTKPTGAPDFIVFMVKESLTDGSHVYNVLLGEMKFCAVDEDAAEELAQTISDAINDHTTHNAGVVCDY